MQFYPGKYPCEKPADMLQQIISASGRTGDVAADFFMGSGSTVKAALALGRRAIGGSLKRHALIRLYRKLPSCQEEASEDDVFSQPLFNFPEHIGMPWQLSCRGIAEL